MRLWIVRWVPLVVLAACTDLPNEPSRWNAGTRCGACGQGGNAKSSLDLIEDDVAAGSLDKQNADIYREAALSDPVRMVTGVARDLGRGCRV